MHGAPNCDWPLAHDAQADNFVCSHLTNRLEQCRDAGDYHVSSTHPLSWGQARINCDNNKQEGEESKQVALTIA